MFQDNLMLGVGLNTFTAKVESYTSNPEVVRFIQPVHHIGYLLVAETGLLGIVLMASVLILLIRHKKIKDTSLFNKRFLFLSTLPIMVLDHYLLTNQTGLLLLVLLVAYNRNSNAI